MLKIGVTGGLGAGKTTASQMFARLGAAVIDTDEISRELTAAGGLALPAIWEHFGNGVFLPDGSLDRAALRGQILADDAARRRLEQILHPLIRAEAGRRLAAVGAPYALVVVPLLVETGTYDDLLDRVLVVDCAEDTQFQRARARGGWSDQEVRAMMAKQASRQNRLARADDIISTDCDMAALSAQVAAMDQKYRTLAAQML